MGQGSEVYLIRSGRPVRIGLIELRLLRLPFVCAWRTIPARRLATSAHAA
jgi:hypothetical protein